MNVKLQQLKFQITFFRSHSTCSVT